MDIGNPGEGYTGIIYQKPSPFPDTSIDLLRGNMTFKNTTKEMWYEVFKEGPPVNNLKQMEVVEVVSPLESIIYQRTSLPVLSDREHLVRMKRVELNDSEALLLIQSTVHPSKPVTDDIVRA